MRAPVSPSPDGFDGLLEQWLSHLHHNEGAADSTVRCYEQHLVRLRKWFQSPPAAERLQPSGSDPLGATSADLHKYTGIFAHSLGITPISRRPIVAAVRGFYAWLHEQRAIAANPAEKLPYPYAGAPLPRAPSLGEASKLLMQPDIETFLGLRDACMLATLMGCGLRISGLTAMNEGSLLWENEEGVEHLTLRVTEKGKRDRLVPAPRELAILLRAYLGHPDLASLERTTKQGDRVLFVSTRNRAIDVSEYHGERRRISQRSVRDTIERYAKRAGLLPGTRHPHGLRHLFGTELAESDVPTLTSQALMGHVDPKNTEIYTHLAKRKLREVVHKASPLSKMDSPLLATLRSLDRATTQAAMRVSARPPGADNAQTKGLRHGKK